MQQKLSLFFVSWVALSRTCNPKLRVSLVCFSSCASVCHGKCWHGMFPLSHSFACSAEVSVPCVSVVYFSSVSVAWQCCSSWSFLHLVLIMWGPLDFHLTVFLWGHCSGLYNREALGAAAVCKCSLQSSVQPWQSGFTSCLICCSFHCWCCPKLPGFPESTEMWEKQNWKAARRGVGRSSPRRSSVFPAP